MKRWSCLFMLFVHKAQKLLLLCFFLGGGEGGGRRPLGIRSLGFIMGVGFLQESPSKICFI